jgi:hypothetical protein
VSVLYGFDLIVPRSALRKALEALARHADPEGDCEIRIPGEPALRFPFDAAGEDGPVEVIDLGEDDSTDSWLQGSLWFPIDDCVREYLSQPGRQDKRRTSFGVEEASIGLISIHLHAGDRYSIVALVAAVSSMSFLFEESGAVRERIAAIAALAGAVSALLSRQPGEAYEPVDEPGRHLRIDSYEGDDAKSIDRFAEDVLRKLSGAT